MLITRTDALSQGYTIDAHAPGRPIAYKGPRVAPTAVVGLFTAHEEELRAALAEIANPHPDRNTHPQGLAETILARPPQT